MIECNHERFFLPGLAGVDPGILRAAAAQMIHHRGKEMVGLLERVNNGLRHLFRTKRDVMVGTCTATAFMEMAVRSGVRRRVLCLIGGGYGERFAGIAESVGREVVRLSVPPGRTIEPDMLEDALKRSEVDAVTLVHSETSTGALAPLNELATVVGELDDVMLIVDGVTSVGASPVETDRWGLDYVLTGSYGALGLPPGLALGVASERLCDRAKSIPERGAALDMVAFQSAAETFQPPFTPAIPLLFGLDEQLGRIEGSGGIQKRWEKHDAMRAVVERWAENEGGDLGFGLLPDPARRSWAVSCVKVPSGELARELCKRLDQQGYSVGSGYGDLKQQTIRIGHMGDHSADEVAEMLAALSVLSAS